MATVTRTSILNKMQDLAGLQTAAEAIPNQLSNTIAPVLDIAPKFTTIVKASSLATSAPATIYTTPTNKDFYLTFLSLSVSKDAACDGVDYYITIYIDGAAIRFPRMAMQTLTASSMTREISFAYPIKVDRGTAIQISGAFTVGTQQRNAEICGFILE